MTTPPPSAPEAVSAPAPSPGSAPQTRGLRLAATVVALIWPAQVLTAAGLLGSNAQAGVAIHFRTTDIVWFMLALGLVTTVVTPFAVRFGDFYGKKRVMLAAAAIGLVGDVIAATATSYDVLLIGRSLAGVYGVMTPLVYALVRDVFPPKHVALVSSLIGGSMSVVAIGGPFLSGWLVDSHGFRGVLWFIAAATAVSLVLIATLVPECSLRIPRVPVDWLGGLLLGGGAAAITYALGKGSTWGWTSGTFLAYALGTAAAFTAFVVVELKAAHPLIDVRMLSRRQVWSVLLVTGVVGGLATGATLVTSLLMLLPNIPGVSFGFGISATKAALYGLPGSILMLATVAVTGLTLRRLDARVPILFGTLVGGAGLVLLALWHDTIWHTAIGTAVFVTGLGAIVACGPVMLLRVVAPHELGTLNGVNVILQGVAGAIGTQLVFVLLAKSGTVVKGTQFYSDVSFRNAYLLGAGFLLAGALLLALIPKLAPVEVTPSAE
ncbi:MFS transporter [Streptomyces collinus]|uniref:MFS transporter n=1 Tax=Streptomyces collinus TaxID=42684 RepID=UPI0036C3A476